MASPNFAEHEYDPEFIGCFIDSFEDFLTERGITSIPTSEQEKVDAGDFDPANKAIIYGEDYDDLSHRIMDVLDAWYGQKVTRDEEEERDR